MSNARLPGPVCNFFGALEIDAGTLCRSASPVPGVVGTSVKPLARRAGEAPAKPKDQAIAGLLYPLAVQATADYHTGARRFGSARAGGRKHAGIDLYAPAGTVVRAMAAGTVRSVYPFYSGTYAIEVDHGSFVARYGEVDGKEANLFVDAGDKVERGDRLALVGKLVGITVPSNMLHLELYANTTRSPLTVRSNKPYQRRADLMDPTASIDAAELE